VQEFERRTSTTYRKGRWRPDGGLLDRFAEPDAAGRELLLRATGARRHPACGTGVNRALTIGA
jgi:hypothetical protein